LGQDVGGEVVGVGGAGLVGGLVGFEQGVGHGLGPQLPDRVGVRQGAKITK
jgi:hypothetical protein